MRLKAENKEKVRERIRAGAAEVLRREGYDAVNLDRIMEAAGLTRGAFYAHYGSKAELFADVVRYEHPVIGMLRARVGSAAELRAEMMGIFADYLAPGHVEEVFNGCSMAALRGDVTRAGAEARLGFETAWGEVVDEMARGWAVVDRAALRAALVLATGAVTTARAFDGYGARAQVLEAAWAGFQALCDGAFQEE